MHNTVSYRTLWRWCCSQKKNLIKWKCIGRISWKFQYWFNLKFCFELDTKRWMLCLSNIPLSIIVTLNLIWFTHKNCFGGLQTPCCELINLLIEWPISHTIHEVLEKPSVCRAQIVIMFQTLQKVICCLKSFDFFSWYSKFILYIWKGKKPKS